MMTNLADMLTKVMMSERRYELSRFHVVRSLRVGFCDPLSQHYPVGGLCWRWCTFWYGG